MKYKQLFFYILNITTVFLRLTVVLFVFFFLINLQLLPKGPSVGCRPQAQGCELVSQKNLCLKNQKKNKTHLHFYIFYICIKNNIDFFFTAFWCFYIQSVSWINSLDDLTTSCFYRLKMKTTFDWGLRWNSVWIRNSSVDQCSDSSYTGVCFPMDIECHGIISARI